MSNKSSTTPRNNFVVPLKGRKSGKHRPKNKKRANGKNKQRELLKEIE